MVGVRRARAPQRLDRGHAGCAQGRQQGSHQGHPDRHAEACDVGPGLQHQAAVGERRTERTEDGAQQFGQADPAEQPDATAEQPDDPGLDHDQPAQLAGGGADGPQQRELAHPLRHDDREGVDDQEGTDEQRHASERQQHVVEEREPLVELCGLLGDLLVDADDLDVVTGHDRGDGIDQVERLHAFLGRDGDLVEATLLAEDLLRPLQRERRRRGAEQAVLLTESRGTDDREVLRAVRQQHRHGVTEREALLLEGGDVDHDVVGSGGRLALTQRDRSVLTGPREPECRRALPTDAVPLRTDQRGEPLDQTDRVGDAVDLLDLVEQGLVERGTAGLVDAGRAPAGELERCDWVDVDVDTGVGLLEQAVERGVDRVGEHERAGHEGDAEHHGQARQGEAQDVAGRGLQCDAEHGGTSRVGACVRPRGRGWPRARGPRRAARAPPPDGRRRGRSRARRVQRPPGRG